MARSLASWMITPVVHFPIGQWRRAL